MYMDFTELSQTAWGCASLGHLPDPLWLASFLTHTRSSVVQVGSFPGMGTLSGGAPLITHTRPLFFPPSSTGKCF